MNRLNFAKRFFRDRNGNPWKPWDYQVESLCSDTERKVHRDGRDVGKTTEIEIVILWAAATLRNSSAMICTQRENHLFPIMERIIRRIDQFQEGDSHWVSKGRPSKLVEKKRSPSYFLRFDNGFELWGRIAGPHGVNFQGMHVDWQLVDEAQEMSDEAWGELYQALNSGGKRWVYGVPNGLRNTFYRMTQMTEYEQYRWPSTLNPLFTESKQKELIKLYGGEDSPGYVHHVLGEHGAPEHAAFNIDDYLACVDESMEYEERHIGREDVKRFNLRELLDLGEQGKRDAKMAYYLGCDLGYTRDPSELVIYRDDGRAMGNVARVHLRYIDFATQQDVIRLLDERFHFRGIGIDNGFNGHAVCHALQAIDARWADIVEGYDFGSKILTGISPEGVEQFQPAKFFMTQLIETRMREGAIRFPKLSDREDQYVSHTYRTTPQGYIIYSKGNDHIIDADRCAVLRHFKRHFHPGGEEFDPGLVVDFF